ncbi:MAG: sigma-70 family RNA polymerase sigma factor [Acidobacteriaceae bacterium]
MQHQSMVYSIALRVTGQSAAAEDVAQEVFMKLYESPEVKEEGHTVSWLRRTTVHRAIDSLRRSRIRAEEELAHEPEATCEPEDPIFANVRDRLMSRLSPEARCVLTLRYQEDLDPGEIASLIGMPVTTVKSHLKRSLAFFRAQLIRQPEKANHE